MPWISGWLLLGLLVATPQGPEIRELSIAASGGQVLVSFRLEGGMTEEVRERIESGLPTTVLYELELMRDRKRWWDRAVETSRIEVVAMYNAVTHEYLVNTKHDGKLIESRTVRELDELESAMTDFDSFPAFAVAAEAARTRFLVRLRVDLGAGAFLGFIPYQRSSAWAESNKVRFQSAES